MAVADTPSLKPVPKKTHGLPFDVPLLAAIGALLILGLMMVYSATFDWSYAEFGSPAAIFIKQLQWMGLGLACLAVAARMDYRWWRPVAVALMALTIVALLLVLAIGATRFNAQRSFFGGSVQPSELAKFATIVYLAVWLASKGDKIRNLSYGLLPFGMIVGLVFTLILLQPDLSAAGTVLVIAALMFFVAGADLLQMGLVILAGGATVGLFMQLPFQFAVTGRQRLAEYLTGIEDLTRASWHVKQAAIAFVNGGLFGRGLGESHQKFGFLPTPHTDSIFAIIGEELGLLGCLLVIGLFVVVAWRGLKIAAQAKDPLGASLAAGITSWVIFEALVNIAVMVGAFPFAGNALPFISYGGSNLVMMLLAMGVLLSISRRSGDDPVQRRVRSTGFWQTPASPGGTDKDAAFDLRRRDGRGRLSRPGRR
ncbi:MAG: cell division protein FtsW [Anaerolineales bacterium]|nr:cell division protein FtsW [Anaerolineales bacterium]